MGAHIRKFRVLGLATLSMTVLMLMTVPAWGDGDDASYNITCGTGEVCVWLDGDFQGSLAATSANEDDHYSNDFFPNTDTLLHDEISSVRNNKTADHVWFVDSHQGGSSLCLNPGFQSPDLGGLNDEFSSFRKDAGSC